MPPLVLVIGDIVRALLWLWLVVAVGVLLWRTYRRVVHHETRHDRAARRRAAEGGDGSTPSTPGADGRVEDRAPEPPRRSLIKRTLAESAPAEEQIEEGALVREAIRNELAAKKAADAPPAPDPAADAPAPTDGGRTGMFAKPTRSVAELVTGIRLPCDLAPLVVDDRLDPRRALFATSGPTPATVASAMADELERLGFRIDAIGDNEALARKPDGDLRVVIHGDVAAFPQAPHDGVVVELTS